MLSTSTAEEATKAPGGGDADAAVAAADATAPVTIGNGEEGEAKSATGGGSGGSESAGAAEPEAGETEGDAAITQCDYFALPPAAPPPPETTATATAAAGAALEREQLDTTSQKVVVHNVLKFLRAKEIAKLTAQWLKGHEATLRIVRTKKPPRDNWVKVTLENEAMVGPFIALINAGGEDGKAMVNGRGKALFAKRADEFLTKGDDRKRKDRDDDGGRDGKRGRAGPATVLSVDEVRDKITPLWRLPYAEQLDQKAREMVTKCAMKIVKDVKKKFAMMEREYKRNKQPPLTVYEWIAKKRAIEMEQPVPSPDRYEYRNKCEFTIGYRFEETAPLAEAQGDGGAAAEASATEGATEEGDAKAAEADAKVEVKEAEMVDGEVKVAGTNTNDEATPPIPAVRKIPAAGFLAQGWSGGVYPPHCLQNMPDWACGLADVLNDFLPASPLPPYDSKVHRGVWRTVTVRCSLRTRECMVIVVHAPASGGAGANGDAAEDYSAAFEGEKKRLVEMLTGRALPTPKRDYPAGHVGEGGEGCGDGEVRVTSVFFQEFVGLSNPSPDHPVQHVYGKKFLEEKLGKCTFQISPGAFFQVNTKGAEVLYNIVLDRIREVTTEPKRTVLLDVCCGTGTIGLTCLKEGVVGTLVGVDISAPAIADARTNAAKNGFAAAGTTRFVAAPAEKALPATLADVPRDAPIVAVVDPARDGLHPSVVRTLRAAEGIARLVYVSCNPTATLVRDAAMLCGPATKKYPGRPFVVTLSQPVDMFPLTKHCECVMTFDRMSEEEYGKYHGSAEKKNKT